MTISSLSGLIWRSQWNAPGEGPYSIVAKLLHANFLPPRYLKDVIRWRSPEGHSLLFPRPLQSSNERVASLGRMLQDSSLSMLARYMHGELAGDQALRYCRTCMSTGFQAAIAQIDGLDVCPIHMEPHLSSCVRCGSRTPPYYLGNNDRLPGFSCRKCSAPFGNSGLIERRPDAWRPPEHLYRLDPIHQWLKKIEDYWCISWPSVSAWETTQFLEEGEEKHRRRAVFNVLSMLAPDPNLSSSTLAPNVEIFGPIALASDQPLEHLTSMVHPDTRQLLPRNELSKHRRNLRMPSFGVAVPDDPIVPPSVHATLIWCAQFELDAETLDGQGIPTGLIADVIPDLLNTHPRMPSGELVKTSITQSALAATWSAANRIAIEWHRLLIDLRRETATPFEVGWRTACNLWIRRLGCWRNYGYFPVGEVVTRDPASGNACIYFVVA